MLRFTLIEGEIVWIADKIEQVKFRRTRWHANASANWLVTPLRAAFSS
jgi:hypothetical protein